MEFFISFEILWNMKRNNCARLGSSLLGCDTVIGWMLRSFNCHSVLMRSQWHGVTSTRLESHRIAVGALNLTIGSVLKWHIWRNSNTCV